MSRVEAAQEVLRVLRQDPVESRQDGLLRSLRDFFRRQGLVIAAALALGLALTEAWDGDRWDGELRDRLLRWTTPIALAGAAVIVQRYAPSGFRPDERALMERLTLNAMQSAKAINNTTYNAVAEARRAGRSVGEVFLEAQAVRAPQQAQTLATGAENQGRDAYTHLLGMKSKIWRVTSKNPRKSHAELNGTTIGIDDTFSNGCRWPGDPEADVDETAGCQCVLDYSFAPPP